MAKAMKPPSKAEMADEERKWRAKSMVEHTMMETPEAKRMVRMAMQEMAQMETRIKQMVKPTKKKGK